MTSYEHKVKNIYLWEPWWGPGENTLLYLPLKDDINDKTGNHTMTLQTTSYWTVTKDNTWFYFFNGWYITSENYKQPKQATLSFYVKRQNKHTSYDTYRWISMHYRNSSPYHYYAVELGNWYTQMQTTNGTKWHNRSGAPIWQWIYFTMTYSKNDWAKVYVNGSLVASGTWWYDLAEYTWPTNVWATYAYTDQFFEWYLSEIIYEDKVRTAEEISDYYENTKSNYWL